MGVLLIAVGMVASLLSSNVTVAFILGAVFCAVPIFLGLMASPLEALRSTGLRAMVGPAQFQDFGTGVVTLVGTALLLRRRGGHALSEHGAAGPSSLGRRRGQPSTMGPCRGPVRVVDPRPVQPRPHRDRMNLPLWALRADASAERLHTLSRESINLVNQIPEDRPVLIQAYYSPEVPREFVETKADLLGLLREYASRSGGKIQLNLVPTDLYSDEAREAEKQFAIEPRRVFTADQGKQMSTEIFLGVAFTSGLEEVVIPFFDRGLPVEYELTRSIRVVSRSGRKKVGILNTDAKMMGGFDMRTFSPRSRVVDRHRAQEAVRRRARSRPTRRSPSDVDVLLVAQPSSLTQKQIDNLTDYVKKGGADLAVPRPIPVRKPVDRARDPKDAAGRPVRRRTAAGAQGQSPAPARPGRPRLAVHRDRLECVQSPSQAVRPAAAEIVFIGTGSGEPMPSIPIRSPARASRRSSPSSPACSGPRSGGSGLDFTPLLRTEPVRRHLFWNDVAQQSFMGFSGSTPERRYIPSGDSIPWPPGSPVSCLPTPSRPRIRTRTRRTPRRRRIEKPGTRRSTSSRSPTSTCIGEQFFEMRRHKIENLDFDNVPFVLNCVDVLAGDESFVGLRKKRLKHRTLDRARRRRPRTLQGTALEGDQGRRGGGHERAQSRTGGLREAGRSGPGPHRPGRADQGDPAREPQGRRPAPARCQEGRHRGREGGQDPREQGRDRNGRLGRSRTRCDSKPPFCRHCPR